MLETLKAYTRVVYLSTPAIYYSYRKFKPAKQYPPRKDTDLCLEAYPSSANSFSFVLIRNLNGSLNIAHHTHAIASLKVALRRKIPTIIIIRNPLDAVSSRLSRFDVDVTTSLLEYLWFYRFVYRHREDLTIYTFEAFTKDTTNTVKSLPHAAKFGWPKEDAYIEQIKDESYQFLNGHYRGDDGGKTEKLYEPERKRSKEELRDLVKNHRYFATAQALYEQILTYVQASSH